MFHSHPVPFQSLIIFNSMVGIRNLGMSNTNPITHARTRALRVGIGEHVEHARGGPKLPDYNYLRFEHAPTIGAREHVIGCHPVRNLLSLGPMGTGATVPFIVFAALSVKFHGTLTLSDCEIALALAFGM
jgi:hypothetical protein